MAKDKDKTTKITAKKRGNNFLERKNYDAAERVFRKMTEKRPQAAAGWLGLARACLRMDRAAEAVEAAATAAALRPDAKAIRLQHAKALAGCDRWAEAEAVLAAMPEALPARLLLADIRDKAGRKDEAAATYRDIVERWPENARAKRKLEALSTGRKSRPVGSV